MESGDPATAGGASPRGEGGGKGGDKFGASKSRNGDGADESGAACDGKDYGAGASKDLRAGSSDLSCFDSGLGSRGGGVHIQNPEEEMATIQGRFLMGTSAGCAAADGMHRSSVNTCSRFGVGRGNSRRRAPSPSLFVVSSPVGIVVQNQGADARAPAVSLSRRTSRPMPP